VAAAPAGDDLPQARATSQPQELPTRPVHPGRRSLRVRRRRHEPGAGSARAQCFICGRGAQEKTIAELKGEFALDVAPTNHYGANSAWQQFSILAHNVARNFQLETLATPKPRSRKRTYAYLLRSMRTLRFLMIARAGRVTRIGGRNVLRLAQNPSVQQLYDRFEQALEA
jgi:hypothetical protein